MGKRWGLPIDLSIRVQEASRAVVLGDLLLREREAHPRIPRCLVATARP